MSGKDRSRLIEEFREETNQMSGEDLLQDILYELRSEESSEPGHPEMVPTISSSYYTEKASSHGKVASWINNPQGKRFIEQYLTVPK